MKNFKINKNQPTLSEADIAKGKDFAKLLNAYKATKVPFYKTPNLWIGASSILVASVVVLLILNKMNSATNVNRPFIAPPIVSADIQGVSYVLNAQSDSTIAYPGGSKIHVPANAFLDKKGNVVTGKVELHYREFKKVDEVFLAGIPMAYDSAGEQFHFETAGMLEISASQNGEALKTNPVALIKVDLVSLNKEDRFNTYYLDTIEKRWKYINRPNLNVLTRVADTIETWAGQPNIEKDNNLNRLTNEIAALEKRKPQKPQKQAKDKPRFSIKVDPREFPEIAVYKNVKFQVEDSSYKPEKADITWADIELKRMPGNNKYQITFINPKEKYQVVAVPVFADKDIEMANAIYNRKFEEYEAALTKKKSDEAALQVKIKTQYEDMEKRQKASDDKWTQSDLIYRSFEVSDFGYWNSDHPCRLPAGNTTVKLTLVDAQTKKPIEVQLCYLVEKERNALFVYGATGLARFKYDPAKQNGVWIITSDNKLGVAKYSVFKAGRRTANELTLQVTLMDKTLNTTEEVKHYLEL